MIKILQPSSADRDILIRKSQILPPDERSVQSLTPSTPLPYSLFRSDVELEPAPEIKSSLPKLFSQQYGTPQDDESFARYYKDQSNILYVYEVELTPTEEKRIDLSSNRWFDILALDGLLFQTQMNAFSKEVTESPSPAHNFRMQLILLKFICANGPCATRSESDIKKACLLAQREIFELRRLLKQALKEEKGIHNLCNKISEYYHWCLRNRIIDKKMYETMKKFVEDHSIKRKPKEFLRQLNKIRAIYGKILTKLYSLISQLNKKSFYFIKMLFEDLYYLTLPTENIPDHEEVVSCTRDIYKHVESYTEDFYRNILEKEYPAEAKKYLFSITNLNELKSMIDAKERDFTKLWSTAASMFNTLVYYLRDLFQAKLGYSLSDETKHFVECLFCCPYSFIMSKIFSYVNWPLLYGLLAIFESCDQANGPRMEMPKLNMLLADLRLTFSSKNLGDTMQKETIPIHLNKYLTKDTCDENKIYKVLDSAISGNDKLTSNDDLKLIEFELLKFFETNTPKIIGQKLKELRNKYNESFEVSDFDIIIYSPKQYEGVKDEVLLSKIYHNVEQFLVKNFGTVNLKTKNRTIQYCFSFRKNEEIPTKPKVEKKLTKIKNKQKEKTKEKKQSLAENSMTSEIPDRNSKSPKVKTKRKFRRGFREPKQKTSVDQLEFLEDIRIKPTRSSSFDPKKLPKKRFRRIKDKIIYRPLPPEKDLMAGQNLCFSYELIERIALYRSFDLPVRTYFVLEKTLNEDKEHLLKSCAKSMKEAQTLLSENHSLVSEQQIIPKLMEVEAEEEKQPAEKSTISLNKIDSTKGTLNSPSEVNHDEKWDIQEDFGSKNISEDEREFNNWFTFSSKKWI